MSLMGYIAAGAVSGAGSAVKEGAQNLQQAWTQKMLQEERAKIETERDARLEEFQRGQQQTQIGANIALEGQRQNFETSRDTTKYAQVKETETRQAEAATTLREQIRNEAQDLLDLQHSEGQQRKDVEAAATKERLTLEANKGNLQAKTELAQAEYAAGKPLAEQKVLDASTLEKQAMIEKANDPVYMKAITTLKRASASDLEKAQADLTRWKVNHAFLEVNKADAVTASLVMRDATTDIDRLSNLLNTAQMTGDTAQIATLTRQIQDSESIRASARARAAELSGITLTKAPAPRTGVLDDPFSAASPLASQPAGPAPRPLSQVPSQDFTGTTVERTRPVMPRGTVPPERIQQIAKQQLDYDVQEALSALTKAKQHGNAAQVRAKQERYDALVRQQSGSLAGSVR